MRCQAEKICKSVADGEMIYMIGGESGETQNTSYFAYSETGAYQSMDHMIVNQRVINFFTGSAKVAVCKVEFEEGDVKFSYIHQPENMPQVQIDAILGATENVSCELKNQEK